MTVAFFLEELSAKAMLETLISTFFCDSNIRFDYYIFEGKQDLDKNIANKIKGWRTPDTTFIIIRDQDSGDCRNIKTALLEKCSNYGRSNVIVRIACHELESFYLGDLAAVERGLNKLLAENNSGKLPKLARLQSKAKFRDPDSIICPSKELMCLTKNRYEKVNGSRYIAEHFDPQNNKSRSFNALYSKLAEICNRE
jgi:hypothetical protein